MTYNDVIKKLESVGIEIDYSRINVSNLDGVCDDAKSFEKQIRLNK